MHEHRTQPLATRVHAGAGWDGVRPAQLGFMGAAPALTTHAHTEGEVSIIIIKKGAQEKTQTFHNPQTKIKYKAGGTKI